MNKIEKAILGGLFAVFIVMHLFGLHSPYHQDEYKWVFYAHPEITAPGTVPHPPLTEFIYTKIAPIFGDANFRYVPFLFGIADFFLIFYLAKTIFDKRTALWTSFLFTASFYSLLATIMVDVDGAVMPFFFLLLVIGYYKWRQSDWKEFSWGFLLLIGAIGGFMIKVSFVLPMAALFLDFLIEKRIFSDWKKVLKYLLCAIGGAGVLVLILLLAKFIFPFFNLAYALQYWEHFIVFAGRGWFQTAIQFFKAILYTSPLLILPAFLVNKEVFVKTRPFYLFIGIGLFFYLIMFDFSIGALDRYFQFVVVPLCIISAAVFNYGLSGVFQRVKKSHIIGIALVAIMLLLIQFLPHIVPALHPKSEWLARVVSLKWNFLYPFSGGSGPLGFYVSFMFMALTWLATIALTVISYFKPHLRMYALLGILLFGFAYNRVFAEEYLFGRINGSASKVLTSAVEYIKNNPDIKMVTVYNDNGGYEIQILGKYRKRLYTDPKFDAVEKISNLNKFKEFYLEVNVPRIDPTSFYRRYLDSCKIAHQQTDGNISATVYDCRKAPDIKL